MILHSLHSYYQRKCDDVDPAKRLPIFGLEQKEIPFLLEITRDGKLVQLIDTRTLNGKKQVAENFRVPLGLKRAAGIAANLLWDNLEYVLGIDTRGNPEKVIEKHAQFVSRIKALPQTAQDDVGIQAVLAFLAEVDKVQLQAQPAWTQAFESNAVMTFRLHDDINLVCQRPAVLNAALTMVADEEHRLGMCLVTGNVAPMQRLHASIKGVWGAQAAGANIVSFNARAFESYGKTERQGENAPVSQAAAFAYTTALNHLLRKDSTQRIQVGDSSTVFWADRDSEFESIAADIFGEQPKDDPDRSARAVHALLNAIETGTPGSTDDKDLFYILGLAPNAARISIRFYHRVTLKALGEDIRQHFTDLEMVRGPYDPQYPSLFRLMAAVALQNKADNIPSNLGGAIIDAVFAGPDVPYPRVWLNAALSRCRAEQNVNYLRACGIKACLNRQIRRSNSQPNPFPEKEFLPMLDFTNNNTAYRLGRLFAVLERIQEAAADGLKLNSTIRDRYYGAASSAPVAVFTTLLRLKNFHLKKLTTGQSISFEKLLGEILSTVDDFPKHLPLADQGRFALGYYHQRQDAFTKKSDKLTANPEGK